MFVVVDMQAKFIQPARFNDQLVVTAGLSRLTRASFDIEQNIFRDHLDGPVLVSGSVRAAFLDADTKRPLRVPPGLFEGL